MGWVCEFCSNTNDDSSDICPVCGYRREGSGADLTEDGLLPIEFEAESETDGGVTERDSTFLRVISILFPILFFAIGQIVLYVLFATEGKVLFLTRFIKGSERYEFDLTLFLILTSVVGLISCVLAVCNNFSLAVRGREFCVYLATLPYCITMVLCPSFSACWLLLLEFIGLFLRKRHAFHAIICLASIFAVVSIVVLPSVAAAIGETYTLTFDSQGGVGGSVRKEAKFEKVMPIAEAPKKEGYIFKGYYDSKFGGTQYYNSDMESIRIWDMQEDCILYAHWTAETYNVTLNRRGGSGGSTKVEVAYNASMPFASAPTRIGYTFLGYFDGIYTGVQYYDHNMKSCRKWDKLRGDTLYARWSATKYVAAQEIQGENKASQFAAISEAEMHVSGKSSQIGSAFYANFPHSIGFLQVRF